jgi:hypothetical protein
MSYSEKVIESFNKLMPKQLNSLGRRRWCTSAQFLWSNAAPKEIIIPLSNAFSIEANTLVDLQQYRGKSRTCELPGTE